MTFSGYVWFLEKLKKKNEEEKTRRRIKNEVKVIQVK